MNSDYEKRMHFDVEPNTVFDALTTLSGLSGWWAPVTGSGSEGGELRFIFGDDHEDLVARVEAARRASSVIWHATSCGVLPDWVGTSPSFWLKPTDSGGCDLHFRHKGLTPQLECYDQCQKGWDYYLRSLKAYVEIGRGNPVVPVGGESSSAVER